MRVNSIQHTFMEHLSGVRYEYQASCLWRWSTLSVECVSQDKATSYLKKKRKMTVFPQEHQRDIFA